MKESEIEEFLVKKVRSDLGGQCIKLQGVGNAGQPDRICILPNGIVFFVEVKNATGVLSPIQKSKISRLKKLGYCVFVPDSTEKVKEIINVYKSIIV